MAVFQLSRVKRKPKKLTILFEKIRLGKRIRVYHNLRLQSQHASRLTDFGAKLVTARTLKALRQSPLSLWKIALHMLYCRAPPHDHSVGCRHLGPRHRETVNRAYRTKMATTSWLFTTFGENGESSAGGRSGLHKNSYISAW